MVTKGFIKTMEAGIAIVLILASVVFLFTQKEEYEPQLSSVGYNCLKNLDNSGILRYYAENKMESSLISDLRDCIPPLFNYNVKICITSSCISQLPSDKDIFLSSYLIAGDDSIEPTLINLWVWST